MIKATESVKKKRKSEGTRVYVLYYLFSGKYIYEYYMEIFLLLLIYI